MKSNVAALFTDAFELIEHYVFPSISGGKVMTVTPPSGSDRPAPAAVVAVAEAEAEPDNEY